MHRLAVPSHGTMGPMRDESRARPIEIACDESGYEGEKLIGGTTDVFAHASVGLTADESADCIAELRRRIRSPAQEYKANHLLREKHRDVLVWWLGDDGPVQGRARVLLVDKTYRLVSGLSDVLDAGGSGAEAVTLYRDGPTVFGRDKWLVFLDAFNNLVRAKDRLTASASAAAFQHTVGLMGVSTLNGEVGEILRPLTVEIAGVIGRAQTSERSRSMPPFDPLIPAILEAVSRWGGADRPVSIVHDRQNLLTRGRIARLTDLARERGLGLAGFELVDSIADTRVQMADFLAGIARKIASLELNGAGDPELTGLLRAHVDGSSTWGDPRSWALLGPG